MTDAPFITIPPIPRWQFWTLIGTIITGFTAVILVLINLIYSGLKGEIKETKESVQALSASYREAITSGIKVQDLLIKAPTFERKIDETHDAAIRLEDALGPLRPLPGKVESMQTQLNSIQRQVHEIPGVPK